MRMFRTFVWRMMAIAIFAILILLFWDTGETGQEHEAYKSYNEGWRLETNGIVTEYEKLPEEVDTAGTGKVVLRRTLDTFLESTSSLGFYTSHQLIDVWVGGRRVYQLYPQEKMTSKTPGNTWNFVQLDRPDAGKEVVVVLTNCYGKEKMAIPTFYLGAKDSIIVWYIRGQLPALFISIVIFLVGIMIVMVYFGIRKTMAINDGALWLGMFAIPLAVWSMMECRVVTFFTSQVLLMSQITFAVLKLIPIPILQFVDAMYGQGDDKILKRICQISAMDFWGTSILQLVGLVDYKESLWVTHVIFITAACYVLVLTVRLLYGRREQRRKSRSTLMLHAVCVGVVSVCALLDMLRYYMGKRMDSALFSRMGLLFYIIVLVILLLRDSVRLIQAGQRVSTIRKESETDVMTKLKNRRAFERDLYAVDEEKLDEYGIIIFDLNNLKRFNDLHGHSMGDYYIIASSEVMQDLFGEYGTIYRIGGDEFCGIVKEIDSSGVEELHQKMCQKLHAISLGEWVKEPMEVAVGFAGFDRSSDGNLSDTMKRADACMYQKKKEMKESSLLMKHGL